jgi:hypothetical protein
MAKAKAAKKKSSEYTRSLDKRRAKLLVNMLGAIELRMFEKGFRPTEAQLRTIAELRQQLSVQVSGESEGSLEEQLTAALNWVSPADKAVK